MSIYHNGKEYGTTKVINYSASPDYNRGVTVDNIQTGNYQATDNGFLMIQLQSQQSNPTKVSVVRNTAPITDTGTEIASIVLSQYQYSETLVAQVMARDYYKLVIEGAGNSQVISCMFYPYATNVPMKLIEDITIEQVAGLENELDGKQNAGNYFDKDTDKIDLANQVKGTLGSNNIANNAITSAKIADSTIVNGDIANATITGAKLANKTITATQIADNTITATQIAANAVTASELANNAVDNAAIANGAVTDNKTSFNSLSLASIEFTKISSSSNHGGYIDFHYNGATDNYTSRLIEKTKGLLSIYNLKGLHINGFNVTLFNKISVDMTAYVDVGTVLQLSADKGQVTLPSGGTWFVWLFVINAANASYNTLISHLSVSAGGTQVGPFNSSDYKLSGLAIRIQ